MNRSKKEIPIVPPAELEASKPEDIPKQQPKKQKKKYKIKTIDSLDANDRVGKVQGIHGRLYCECLAVKHGLLANCLFCGKIVCKLEGPGPCPSCGVLVESRQQQLELLRQSRQDGFHTLLEKAQNQKSKLLQQDQDLETRKIHGTRLLLFYLADQASDFDSTSEIYNKWTRPEDRALALKKHQALEQEKEEAKSKRTMTLDFDRQEFVLEESPRIVANPRVSSARFVQSVE